MILTLRQILDTLDFLAAYVNMEKESLTVMENICSNTL